MAVVPATEAWLCARQATEAGLRRNFFNERDRLRMTGAYLLSGLIRCQRCGHNWQGYTTRKGRRKLDGSQVKTHYYACNGYVAKGTTCCQRAVIPQEFIETWVLEQIGGIVHGILTNGGEKKLRKMIEQEVAGAGRADGSQLAAARQRKADIQATIDNLLDNITPTNRDYVDRRIEKLRDEIVELERQEAVLTQQQDQQQQAVVLAEEAFAVARSFDRLVEVGTVDEKRGVVRAFLRGIDFDPASSSGKTHFRLVPSPGWDDSDTSLPGRGRRGDVANAPARAGQGTSDGPRADVFFWVRSG